MMRIALFLLTNLAVMVVFGLVLSLTGIQSSSMTGLLIMALLFGFGGSIVSLMMSKWMALKSVGGEVIEQPRNETERWLMNTVAQQAQQVGIAMPQVAIYHAPDINAFATGARRDASLVAVSTGLLQNMSRDEAEAVIAHEISHIANGDMVTMTLIQGVVNTFVIFISRVIAQIAASKNIVWTEKVPSTEEYFKSLFVEHKRKYALWEMMLDKIDGLAIEKDSVSYSA